MVTVMSKPLKNRSLDDAEAPAAVEAGVPPDEHGEKSSQRSSSTSSSSSSTSSTSYTKKKKKSEKSKKHHKKHKKEKNEKNYKKEKKESSETNDKQVIAAAVAARRKATARVIRAAAEPGDHHLFPLAMLVWWHSLEQGDGEPDNDDG
jgi:ATP-dependent 26S proteasome regulatory subunit